jgi:DMSO/TMAO reductase YedYZ molybdopterin-dependent catalytic subunit
MADLPRPEPTAGPLTFEELGLAARNRGLPLEALRWDTTPPGLHYLLVHFDIPTIDAATWRLRVSGLVRRPLELTLEDIVKRPAMTLPVTMECAGNGRARLQPRPVSQPWLDEAIGTARWTGTPLAVLLEEAGVLAEAIELVFRGADRGIQGGREENYGRALTIADAMRPEVMLVWAMDDEPLPPQHGFPVRLIVPGWYGMTSVKWLTSIEAVGQPYQGYQQTVAYQYASDADDPGQPASRMRVRALMVPPGIPEFLTRRRFLEAGPTRLMGRAWSGAAPIRRVEVGVDDHWAEAALEPHVGDFAWRGWSFDWQATAGDHELSCRATDATGAVQPLEAPWDYRGLGNNAIQRVEVTVRGR